MWIIRIAIVVGVAVAMLPRDPEQQARLMQRTRSAVTWTVTFCDRNAATCTTARELWSEAAIKGEFAVSLAAKAYQDWAEPTGNIDPLSRRTVSAQHGTLTDADRIPAWRGARTHGN